MENNGRWWRKPSFSLEDIIKMAIFIGPALGIAVWIWKTFGDVPSDVATIKRTMATKDQVQSVITQANEINRLDASRLVKLEKVAKLLEQYPAYRDIVVYHREPRRTEWDWEVK